MELQVTGLEHNTFTYVEHLTKLLPNQVTCHCILKRMTDTPFQVLDTSEILAAKES